MKKNDYVDVEPVVLFKKAEKNIAGLNSFLNDNDVSEDTHYENICYNITQAVEKFLKGYIVANNGKVKKIHELDIINKIAENINEDFKEINEDCLNLSNYTASIRYDDKHKIEKYEIKEVLKNLRKIYHFKPIKEMRELFQKSGNYIILPDFDFLKNDEDQP